MLVVISEAERIAIIGLISSISVAFLTLLGGLFTNWTTIYIAHLNKDQKETSTDRKNIILPTSQSKQIIKARTKFQIKPLWISIILAAGFFLTIVILLIFEHKQHIPEKHTYRGPDYCVEMGNQYADMWDYSRAESWYRQALEKDGEDANIHDKLAVVLRERGKLEEALEENLTAVAIDSSVGEYHFHKGLTLQSMGDRKNRNEEVVEARRHYKSAEDAFQAAIELEPTVAKYHLFLAIAKENMTRYIDAEKAYLAAIELESNNAEYHREYARFLNGQERWEDSLKESKQAIELNPDDGTAYSRLASALYGLGRINEADKANAIAFQLQTNIIN